MNRRLRVTMVTGDFYPDSTGGVQRVVYHLAKGLTERGHGVTVATRKPDDRFPDAERIEGIRVVRFSSNAGGATRFHVSEVLSSRRAFRSAMATERADVVHIHEPLPGLGAVSVLAGTGVPIVYTFHGFWAVQWLDARRYGSRRSGVGAELFARYLRAVEQSVMRRARRVAAVSRFMAKTAAGLYGIAPQRLRIIPNGVDLERFSPGPQPTAREAFGLAEDGLVLGFAGRLSGEKGVSFLLRGVALLAKGGHDLALLVAGEGPERAALERQATELGIGGRVRFLGPVRDMPAFYNALDLSVVPSIREPFGLVAVESLACGTPVLGSPVGGVAEVLRPFDGRLVLPEISAEAIARRVEELLPCLTPDLRRRCRGRVEGTFSWDRTVDAYERLYLECV